MRKQAPPGVRASSVAGPQHALRNEHRQAGTRRCDRSPRPRPSQPPPSRQPPHLRSQHHALGWRQGHRHAPGLQEAGIKRVTPAGRYRMQLLLLQGSDRRQQRHHTQQWRPRGRSQGPGQVWAGPPPHLKCSTKKAMHSAPSSMVCQRSSVSQGSICSGAGNSKGRLMGGWQEGAHVHAHAAPARRQACHEQACPTCLYKEGGDSQHFKTGHHGSGEPREWEDGRRDARTCTEGGGQGAQHLEAGREPPLDACTTMPPCVQPPGPCGLSSSRLLACTLPLKTQQQGPPRIHVQPSPPHPSKASTLRAPRITSSCTPSTKQAGTSRRASQKGRAPEDSARLAAAT